MLKQYLKIGKSKYIFKNIDPNFFNFFYHFKNRMTNALERREIINLKALMADAGYKCNETAYKNMDTKNSIEKA